MITKVSVQDEVISTHNPHPEVAAKRPSKGLVQQTRSILMDASRLASLAPQHEDNVIKILSGSRSRK